MIYSFTIFFELLELEKHEETWWFSFSKAMKSLLVNSLKKYKFVKKNNGYSPIIVIYWYGFKKLLMVIYSVVSIIFWIV